MNDAIKRFREQIRDKGVDEKMNSFYNRVETFLVAELLNEQERIALKAKLDMERILNDFEYIFAPDGYIRGDRRFVLGNMKKWLKQQLNRLAELKEGGE